MGSGRGRIIHATKSRASADITPFTDPFPVVVSTTLAGNGPLSTIRGAIEAGCLRWKVGDALASLPRKATLKPKDPVVTQQMDEVFRRFLAGAPVAVLPADDPAVLALRVPEAQQIRDMVAARAGRKDR